MPTPSADHRGERGGPLGHVDQSCGDADERRPTCRGPAARPRSAGPPRRRAERDEQDDRGRQDADQLGRPPPSAARSAPPPSSSCRPSPSAASASAITLVLEGIGSSHEGRSSPTAAYSILPSVEVRAGPARRRRPPPPPRRGTGPTRSPARRRQGALGRLQDDVDRLSRACCGERSLGSFVSSARLDSVPGNAKSLTHLRADPRLETARVTASSASHPTTSRARPRWRNDQPGDAGERRCDGRGAGRGCWTGACERSSPWAVGRQGTRACVTSPDGRDAPHGRTSASVARGTSPVPPPRRCARPCRDANFWAPMGMAFFAAFSCATGRCFFFDRRRAHRGRLRRHGRADGLGGGLGTPAGDHRPLDALGRRARSSARRCRCCFGAGSVCPTSRSP